MDKFEHNFCNKDVSIVTKSSNKTKQKTERVKRRNCPPGTVPKLQTVLVENYREYFII